MVGTGRCLPLQRGRYLGSAVVSGGPLPRTDGIGVPILKQAACDFSLTLLGPNARNSRPAPQTSAPFNLLFS